ncbi:MAG: T9SS type A sorting domain-containing protein [Saprospiraceae bacterium]|nr:T9SS type A sorting domain-containing protein [Saprospiraceae bacterium]
MPLSVEKNLIINGKLIIYPNPASNEIYIKNYFGPISVFDQLSRNCLKTEGNSVDLSELPNGLYLVKTSVGIGKIILNR